VPAKAGRLNAVAPVDLPEHVAESDEWQQWPRKLEAHLKWGVRQRQIEAFTRNGRLKVYACPDGTKRIEPEALRELFGEPGIVQGRDRDISATERKARQLEAEAAKVAVNDPVAFMFARVVQQQEALFGQLLEQLKLSTEPVRMLLSEHRETIRIQAERIKTLEESADAMQRARAELLDAQQVRDLELKKHENAERRRDQTLELLKEQLPMLAKTWFEGNTLSEFAKRTPKGAVEAIIESEDISEQDREILRTAAGIPKPAPTPTATANGAASHGHS
jgi:hypothetical protein